jgi:3-hydroxybutyryl-CoA dehydratase
MSERDIIQEGCEVEFQKRVTEADINQFAELSGDFAPNHVDEAFMAKSAYGKRIAHGALLIAYTSRASSQIIENFASPQADATPISLGYDRIRFIKPVFIDDTITVRYVVESFDTEAARSLAKIEVSNENGDLVAVATHIMKWVPN